MRPLDIVTTAGANADIATAFNTLPGTQTVGEEGQLFVRGGSAHETQTFIDGMRVENFYSSKVPDIPNRGRFSPFAFKGLLFSTGGYSAAYGQALSSAMILETSDLPTKTSTNLSLMTLGGGVNHAQKWEKTSFTAGIDYFNLAPYFALASNNYDFQHPPSSVSGAMSFRRKTSETGMLKAFANASSSHTAINYASGSNIVGGSFFDIKNQNAYINAHYKELLGEKWTLETGLAGGYNDDAIQLTDAAVTENNQYVQARATVKGSLSKKFKIHTGAETLVSRFAESYTPTGLEKLETTHDEQFGAAFVEADIKASKTIVMRAGLRGEYSALLDRYDLAPRLSAAIKTADHSQISMAWGRFFQRPEYELLRFNEALEFEQADHFIANYQWVKDKQTFRIEGYYKPYKKLVKYDPNNPNASSYNNDGDGYARGIDIFWRDKKTFKRTDYWISYSFLDTERDYRDFPESATPYFASKHNLSIVTKRYFVKLKMQFGATFQYASPRPF
ncbi:MAG: TonB-dependent receptor plug domain-containing protein, partial [Methylococcales bacterium]|nr:TonB-dependent receptor plug domain-containing protein [Methylococcales bacterium]